MEAKTIGETMMESELTAKAMMIIVFIIFSSIFVLFAVLSYICMMNIFEHKNGRIGSFFSW